MAWPSTTISTANLDQGSDSISAARADLYQAVVAVNDIINAGLGNIGNIEVNIANVVTLGTAQTITGDKEFDGNVELQYIIQTVNPGNANVSLGGDNISSSVNASNVLYPNFSAGSVQYFAVDQDFTIGEPQGLPDGGAMTLIMQQAAGGPYTMSRTGQMWFSNNSYSTLSTVEEQTDVLHIFNPVVFGYLCTLVTGYTPP